MNELLTLMPKAFVVIGVMAFVVAVIIEVIKNLGFLKDVYTDFLVMLVSIALSVAAFAAYADYYAVAVTWYMIVGTVIGGFFVAFVSMFGWTKFKELLERYKYDKPE